MSDEVFPTLPGLSWGRVRTDAFKTTVFEALSGAERRIGYRTTPKRKLQLVYEVLRSTRALPELETLRAFWYARRGAFDSFLFEDPSDALAVNQQFGVGDGTTTIFQLGRWCAGQFEPVHNPQPATLDIGRVWFPALGDAAWFWPELLGDWSDEASIYYPPTGSVTLLSNGRVQFATAPGAGLRLMWTGRYYWRARFDGDALESNELMQLLFEAKKVGMVLSLQNII